MKRSQDFLYVLVVCGAKAAVAWPCTHSEEVIRKLRPQMNGNKNEKKKKKSGPVSPLSIPPPTCQRVTNFQAVAGHRQAEGLGSRGYSWISCTAWQIMAGSSTARCAHHTRSTGCRGDETTRRINHAGLARRGCYNLQRARQKLAEVNQDPSERDPRMWQKPWRNVPKVCARDIAAYLAAAIIFCLTAAGTDRSTCRFGWTATLWFVLLSEF